MIGVYTCPRYITTNEGSKIVMSGCNTNYNYNQNQNLSKQNKSNEKDHKNTDLSFKEVLDKVLSK